jgi:hypothetical protein
MLAPLGRARGDKAIGPPPGAGATPTVGLRAVPGFLVDRLAVGWR